MSPSDSPLKTTAVPIIDEVDRQKAILRRNPFVSQMLEAFPECAAIVNSKRRIVLANIALQEVLRREEGYTIDGQRLGDHMHCVNALSGEDGCGSSEACSTCGALIAQLSALDGKTDIQECCLTIRHEDVTSSLDFRVYTSPLVIEGEKFSVVSLVDISDEKRRRILERIFFHDVNNTAGAIYGLSALIPAIDEEEERAELIQRVAIASRQLLDEIESQRDLVAAENNELKVSLQEVPANDLLEGVKALYEHHPVSEHRTIAIENCTSCVAISDRTQLARCISNLVKNALEAIAPNETVTLSTTDEGNGTITFKVHNPGRIPRDVELQIFHRSFTTKGVGRGLGTYSVRLLTERYLNGSVGFSTSDEAGTEFFVTVPKAEHL